MTFQPPRGRLTRHEWHLRPQQSAASLPSAAGKRSADAGSGADPIFSLCPDHLKTRSIHSSAGWLAPSGRHAPLAPGQLDF